MYFSLYLKWFFSSLAKKCLYLELKININGLNNKELGQIISFSFSIWGGKILSYLVILICFFLTCLNFLVWLKENNATSKLWLPLCDMVVDIISDRKCV